jgi:chemotaxis family two-component system response regulator Rcp1
VVDRTCQILIVEDNAADVRLLKEAFRESDAPHQLHTVQDGDDALDFVFRRKKYANKPRPDLILLDINLPGKNGHEILSTVKSDPTLMRIPVLMLTSSASPVDVEKAYDHHANAYLQKPGELMDYFNLIAQIDQFWLHVVKLPPVRL